MSEGGGGLERADAYDIYNKNSIDDYTFAKDGRWRDMILDRGHRSRVILLFYI